LESPVLVVDIGGGSTEFVLGGLTDDVQIQSSVSMNIGCVRMTERHLADDPPSQSQIVAVESDIAAAFDEAQRTVDFSLAKTVVGVAGTVTTVSAMALDLERYDPGVIHGSNLTSGQIEDLTQRLLSMTRAERAALPFMHEGRVDVIGGGALILRELARRTHPISIRVSEYDILDGIVYRLAQTGS
jgi:exopolyphosphatase/guanosine-5'-triphosphate,3'-diphosphate pyrophosphatase